MERMFGVFRLAVAAGGGFLGMALGGFDGFIYTLALFMVVDYVTGVLAAFKEKKLNSRVGFWGIARKVCVLCMVMIGNFIDVYVLGVGSALRTAVVFFYLANEGLSVLENLNKLEVPFPDVIRDALLRIKDDKRGDGGGGGDGGEVVGGDDDSR